MITEDLLKTIDNECVNGVWASATGVAFLRRLFFVIEDNPRAPVELRCSLENAIESKKAYEYAKKLKGDGVNIIQHVLLNTYSRELKNVLRDVKQLMTNEYSSEHAEMLVELFLNKECK